MKIYNSDDEEKKIEFFKCRFAFVRISFYVHLYVDVCFLS